MDDTTGRGARDYRQGGRAPDERVAQCMRRLYVCVSQTPPVLSCGGSTAFFFRDGKGQTKPQRTMRGYDAMLYCVPVGWLTAFCLGQGEPSRDTVQTTITIAIIVVYGTNSTNSRDSKN